MRHACNNNNNNNDRAERVDGAPQGPRDWADEMTT
eukprot:CAMPEP_0174377976 /NCGR_PEP_ID=MMETSP0811_2-20130205/121760_1 /TAXON_ID=73025 ORGANISM="Eutreptiella gymnastica-like, Strain CCMP1594" /NCGR_SAMPLE_ID=MMETSP0811_2 /ASSEMBLY_ACC=CAM_ASM_000667 /LENGTH=34 /DNA_ID= /DNA_START= /DNA_END= /DNA_ORIENTATION=